MKCPQCQYDMSRYEMVCPRCQGRGLPDQSREPTLAYKDDSSTARVFLGFFLPVLGVMLYRSDRATRPKRARSTGLGALIGCATWIMALPAIFILVTIVLPASLHARETARRTSCQNNLKQLSLAVFQYAIDHKEQLPDLSSPEAIHTSLDRYIKDPQVYTCPGGGHYTGNPQLRRAFLKSIHNPAQTPLIIETEGTHFDGHNVSYANGHVQWLKK